MIEHRCKGRKPFKIGDLVRCTTGFSHSAYCIVLELQWNSLDRCWNGLFLWQSTGQKLWYPTKYYVPMGKNHD
jgi:hypothetical protein